MPSTWSEFARPMAIGVHHRAFADQLDGLARIAAGLFGAPAALISLATPSGPVIVGRAGLQEDPAIDDAALSGWVPDGQAGVIVHDARADPRFLADSLVTGDRHIRFFAGFALIGSDSRTIGTVCVIDTSERASVDERAIGELEILARATTACLERWGLTMLQDGLVSLPTDARVSGRFETLADALPQLVWSTRTDGWSDYFSRQWCEFTGASPAASYGTGWLDFLYPDDVPPTHEAWRIAVETGEPYTVEFRLRHADGTYRWMLVRGLPVTDEVGRITRWVGTCTDIDERVRTGDLMEFMSRELSHRIKNLFSVVQGLISMALRGKPGMNDVSQALQARMVSLGRAHDLIRPRIAEGTILRSQTTLRELIEILTLPYVQDDRSRLEIVGDDIVVHEQAATPLSLYLHEMAINSARFGALSVPHGRLYITIAVEDDLRLEWREQGGPPIHTEPEAGFGIGLTRLGIERQLGGTLTLSWLSDGLHAKAQIPLRQLASD